MEPSTAAQAAQAASSAAGNAGTPLAASSAMEPVLAASVNGTTLAASANGTTLVASANGTTLVASNAAPGAGSVPGVDVAESLFAWGGYFEALGWLCFALALLWLLLWFVKKRGSGRFPGSAASNMHIESRLSLGPKKWLVVTRYRDRRLILGVTEQQITLLSDMPADEAVKKEPDRAAQNDSFATFLKSEGAER